MEPRRKSADSFGTFLEIVQGKTGEQSGDDAVIRLLTALDDSGPAPVSELWPRTGLDIRTFTDALSSAKEVGFASSADQGGEEVVTITVSGAKVAAQARGRP